MKNILITGGLGYVGGRLMEALRHSHHVWVSSRQNYEGLQSGFGGVRFIPHDLLLQNFPAGIDVVIHLAALNEIDSVKFPADAIEVNINQTRQILESAIATSVRQFIYFSTIHVYGKIDEGSTIDEKYLPRPTHPYAITHRAAEDYVIAARDTGKITGQVIRLSNSFGMPALANVNRWTLLVNDICRQAVVHKRIQLQSNGCQYRDFITLTDVVKAVDLLISKTESDSTGIFNLCSGNSMRVMDMAKLVASVYAKMYQNEIPILLPEGSVETQEPGFKFLYSNLEKLGYLPENGFKQELSLLLDFCTRNFT